MNVSPAVQMRWVCIWTGHSLLLEGVLRCMVADRTQKWPARQELIAGTFIICSAVEYAGQGVSEPLLESPPERGKVFVGQFAQQGIGGPAGVWRTKAAEAQRAGLLDVEPLTAGKNTKILKS